VSESITAINFLIEDTFILKYLLYYIVLSLFKVFGLGFFGGVVFFLLMNVFTLVEYNDHEVKLRCTFPYFTFWKVAIDLSFSMVKPLSPQMFSMCDGKLLSPGDLVN
jgi:hypothetical protein